MLDQKQPQYTASDIQVLEGLEAVRRRPSMYIGSTDQRGLHHLVYEIVDNGVDEAMAGYCDRVTIHMYADGLVSISDNGRGIPVDTHATTHRPALETIMTTLHAGGKFGSGAYKVSGGLHGVGASVVNALAETMRVDVRRDGRRYYQEFERGIPTTDVIDDGPIDPDSTEQQGTTVTFMADTTIFGPLNYDFDTLVQRFREMAYLNKGVRIAFSNEARPEADRTFYFEGGIVSFVRQLNHNRETLQEEPFYMEHQADATLIEVALQYNGGFYETTLTFANCINHRRRRHAPRRLPRRAHPGHQQLCQEEQAGSRRPAQLLRRGCPRGADRHRQRPARRAPVRRPRRRGSSATPRPRLRSSRSSCSTSSSISRSTPMKAAASSTSA